MGVRSSKRRVEFCNEMRCRCSDIDYDSVKICWMVLPIVHKHYVEVAYRCGNNHLFRHVYEFGLDYKRSRYGHYEPRRHIVQENNRSLPFATVEWLFDGMPRPNRYSAADFSSFHWACSFYNYLLMSPTLVPEAFREQKTQKHQNRRQKKSRVAVGLCVLSDGLIVVEREVEVPCRYTDRVHAAASEMVESSFELCKAVIGRSKIKFHTHGCS